MCNLPQVLRYVVARSRKTPRYVRNTPHNCVQRNSRGDWAEGKVATRKPAFSDTALAGCQITTQLARAEQAPTEVTQGERRRRNVSFRSQPCVDQRSGTSRRSRLGGG